MKLKIIHIEDSPADAELVKRELTKAGIEADIHLVNTCEEFIDQLTTEPDVILCDHSLPQFNSKVALEVFKKYNYSTPFILVTGSVSEEFAVTTIKNGADDYVLKTSLRRLPIAIISAIEKRIAEKNQKDAISQLRESEERFKLLINTIREGILYTDIHEKILYTNEQFCEMTGLTSAQLIGNYSFEVLTEKENRQIILDQMELRRNGVSSSYKIPLIKDGKKIWILMNVNPVFDDNGLLIGSIKSSMDITKQIEAEIQLQNEKRFLDTVVQNINAGILACDSKGKTTFMNQQFSTFFELSNEMENLHFSCETTLKKLHSEGDGVTALDILSGVINEQKSKSVQLVYKQKNKRKYYNLNCAPLFNQENKLVGALAVFHDLTKIKSLEQARLVNIFEGEERERERMARELHDGLSQMLVAAKMNLSGLISLLENVDEQMQVMLNGTSHLLDSSINEVRSISHNLSPAALQHGLKSALEHICANINQGKALNIECKTDLSTSSIPEAYQHLLYRSAQEILNNVLKHSKAKQAALELYHNEQGVWMEVSDNGIGFDIEKALNAGKGIGLRNLNSRVKAFNGEVTIQSEPGKTVYRVMLPIL